MLTATETCISCFDILKFASSTEFRDRFIHEMVAQHYEFDVYYVAVALPVALIARTVAVYRFVREIFGYCAHIMPHSLISDRRFVTCLFRCIKL